MSFISTLKEQSSAYAAYVALVRLPKNAPRFPDSPHGYPIVEPGELFCRLEGVGRPCCGTKLQTTESLLYHMEAVHGAMMRDRPLQTELSRKNVGELERLHYFYKHLMKDEVRSEKQKPAIKVEASPEVEARPPNTENLPWLDVWPKGLSPPPHVKRNLAKEAFNEVVSKKSKPTISPNVEVMVGSSLPTPTAPKGPPLSRRRPLKDSSQAFLGKWSTADGVFRPDSPPLVYDYDQLQKEAREQAERELERQRLERRFRLLRDPPRSPGGLKRKAADEPSTDSLTEQTPLPPLPNKRPRTGEHPHLVKDEVQSKKSEPLFPDDDPWLIEYRRRYCGPSKRKATEEPSTDSLADHKPKKRPHTGEHQPASSKTLSAKPSTSTFSDDKLELITIRGHKLLKEIAVKEASIKSELKEAQLKEVRIKAELLEVQLLEAQMAQEVSKAKLEQVKLEKGLQEIKEKDERVRAKLEAAAEGKGKVVDLLDDEEDA